MWLICGKENIRALTVMLTVYWLTRVVSLTINHFVLLHYVVCCDDDDGLCEGNSPVTDEFPAQRVSNTEKYFHLMTSSCPRKKLCLILLIKHSAHHYTFHLYIYAFSQITGFLHARLFVMVLLFSCHKIIFEISENYPSEYRPDLCCVTTFGIVDTRDVTYRYW